MSRASISPASPAPTIRVRVTLDCLGPGVTSAQYRMPKRTPPSIMTLRRASMKTMERGKLALLET
ncbi:hypothetical protein D3C72_2288280 [compost metagenome]